ncbi:MAG TPA: type VII secretion protein EccCa [Actinocrinis sp.]|uniref:type VII secretion protein EccCa n=1 Tax=Actinocrinis sp. TaxID=1920516 RepID=UPI002DDCC975|nr:type VII secretion protein EccCa [Actinocrinis sp.]HEV3169989.1 type VII secretion protein EccCa [Actinocrinis sp.]
MSTVIVKRPPRVHPPQVPSGEIHLEPPPELSRTAKGSAGDAAMQALPMLAGVGSVAFFFMPGTNMLMKLMGGMTLLSSLGFVVMSMTKGRGGQGKGKMADARRDYLRYLSQVRARVRETQEQQYTAQMWSHPAPAHLWAIVTSGQRLWERRPTDADFAQVRLGSGAQRLSTPLVAPDTAPVDELEPICADALRRFITVQGTLDALPLAVSFRSFWHVLIGPVGKAGTADDARAEARSILAQLVTFHAPDEVRIAVIAAENRRQHWEWVKWLPHAQHPKDTDAAGPVRLIFGDAAELEDALGGELTDRARFSRDAPPMYDQPHIVVVVDGARASGESMLLHGDGLMGVTVVEIDVDGHSGPVRGGVHLGIEGTVLHLETASGATFTGNADRLSIPQAEALARQLAPLRVGGGADGDEPLLSALDFTDLMGIGDPGQFDTRRGWKRLSPQDRLRVPIGVGENGEPVIIDIKEAAMGGMGPHGLCIGATGSGKSEVLRTLVLALAVTHSSENLNFVLSDFKGGATFAGMSEMPHTAAVITNLADDLTMVDRMRDAIVGEMNRRQEMLRDGGNFKNIHDYEKARSAGAALTPMPNLVIVLDEFSEMLTAKPEFLDLFIQIGRIGRSLGVHLLLASQRLEEGKLRGLDTYLSYRLGLKTFSAAESRVVLGVPDAFNLPSIPGSGYLKTVGQEGGNPAGARFKAAYVSGPYRPQTRTTVERTLDHRRPTFFTSAYQAPPRIDESVVAAPVARQEDDALVDTVLDVLVRQMEGQGPPAHQVWLPPLNEPPTLDQLMPGLQATAQRGLQATEYSGSGRLLVPIGIADKPIEQKREVYQIDLSSAAGHAVVVGGPRTGKSTMVRTILTGLALGHTPAEVQFFCLDFGGGSLATISGLPHMSGVGGRLDQDVVRRIVSEVVSIVDKREESFRRNGIDSIGTFRARRARGELPDELFGDVFLVVDGWQTLRTEFEMLEQDILDVAQRGLGFGVHVIITAARWAEIRPQLKDAVNTRIELRLGDPMESDIDRKVAVNVPAGAPGRGLTKGKLHFLGALPRIDGVEDATDLIDGVAKTVAAIADAWQGPTAPKVRMLPLMVGYHELPPAAQRPGQVVPLGVDETKLEPVYLDFNADPHFLMFGEGESGKTSVLRALIQGITEAYTPQQARILAVDYRRALLGAIPESHQLAYCAAAPAVQSVVAEVRPFLEKRQPGPDVTQEQLRTRSWWTGPEVFVIVDDYDLVATQGSNPLSPLGEFLPMARDLGFHLIISRASGGASRALFEPLIQRIRESRQPGLMLSGEREEGQLIGQVRPSQQPPGRGTLVSRKHGTMLIQTAYLPPPA